MKTKNINNNTVILDCTLRDGGYYNKWDFDYNVVAEYLQAMADAKIDYVELGLRNFPKEGFYGPFAYTTEDFLKTIDLPQGPVYGVMIDAKTILASGYSIEEAIDKLFVNAENSAVELVRIAAHFHEVRESGRIAKKLKEKGYIVGYNLMQAGGKSEQELTESAEIINSWGSVDILYFADSLGNMDINEIDHIIDSIKKGWSDDLGIHTHNNMGRGLNNALHAQLKGVSWLDTTVTGMGRGAGNTQTENLLATYNSKGSKYNPTPVYSLVIRTFEKMQKEYGWGSNLMYFIGAQHQVHPTYIQNLLSDKRYGADEIIGAIEYLSKSETTFYSGELLEEALKINPPSKAVSGTDIIYNYFNNKNVLLLGNGESTNRYKEGIISHIKRTNPIVISININNCIPQEYIDYYCISHNAKFLSERSKYKELKKPIILPAQRFSDDELKMINPNSKIIDYGLSIEKSTLSIHRDHCIIPAELTAGYALAAIANGNARKVGMIGFDGYEKNDPRQNEMIDLIIDIHDQKKDIDIYALTPTTYPIKQRSIYAPNI